MCRRSFCFAPNQSSSRVSTKARGLTSCAKVRFGVSPAGADEVDRRLYDDGLRDRMAPDLILGCGDLPGHYLDYLVSQLNAPLYAIHGNHDAPPTTEGGAEFEKSGASWIGGRAVNVTELLLAAVDGSVRYSQGADQSTQAQ